MARRETRDACNLPGCLAGELPESATMPRGKVTQTLAGSGPQSAVFPLEEPYRLERWDNFSDLIGFSAICHHDGCHWLHSQS